MNATALALTGYIGWILLLLGAIAVVRLQASVVGGKPANSFATDGSDVSPFSGRLCRAHANCYENFPQLGGLMLLALATGTAAMTDPLALVLLAARVAQSAVHLYSTSETAVKVRFAFFLVQYGIAVYWAFGFLNYFLA